MVACGDDEEDPKLEVSTNEITFDAEGETQSLTIDSNVSWSITGNKSWLSVSPTMGKKDATVVLTAQQNTNVENRNCQLTIVSADGVVSQTVKVVQKGAEGELRVNGSTSASLSFGADGGEKQQINITANSDWTITSIPDWIRVSPVNGSKNSTITLTVETENFSDEDREATLVIEGNGISANLNVNQVAKLAKNCRIEFSNMTLMYDGFAADLAFGSDVVGYREAFFEEDDVRGLTDRDIYNKLMEQPEYIQEENYTFSGIYEAGTTIWYCIAAYGRENNSDGTHKYGPAIIKKITTKNITPESDMMLSISYNNLNWNVRAYRGYDTETGINWGQLCSEFYLGYYEGEAATKERIRSYFISSAFWSHFIFKKLMEENAQSLFFYEPQTIEFEKENDEIFVLSWGKNRETGELSSELITRYMDISPEEDEEDEDLRPLGDNGLLHLNRNYKSDYHKQEDLRRSFMQSSVMNKLRENIKIVRVKQ